MELYPWQERVIAAASNQPRRALFAAPRLGKTRATAIMAPRGSRTLVLAPLSVCGAWCDELEAQGIEAWPLYLSGGVDAAAKLYLTGRGEGAMVLNYDKMPDLVPAIKKWKPGGLIFDESHLLKNPQSSRSKAARKLASGMGFVRILTGTPSPNHYGDLWAQMTLVAPDTWGRTWTPFAQRYLIRHPIYPSKIIGHNNVPELQSMINASADIIRREDVFGPDTYQYVTRDLELAPKVREVYDTLVKEWLYFHERGEVLADHALKRLVRLQQLTSGYIRTERDEDIPMHTTKVDAVMADLEEIIESREKAVLFHRFTWEGDVYEKEFARKFPHICSVRISGASSGLERERAIATVRESAESVLCIAQTRTAALGVSFAEATHALFVSQSFSFTDEDQARDRIYKPGYNRCITFYRIRDSVDGFIAKVIASKADIHDSVSHADVRDMAYGRI